MIYSGVIHKVWIDTSLSQMVFFYIPAVMNSNSTRRKSQKGRQQQRGFEKVFKGQKKGTGQVPCSALENIWSPHSQRSWGRVVGLGGT